MDPNKVFEKMHGLLALEEHMDLSTFTSVSMCFLCASMEALEQAPPLVRLQVLRSAAGFLDEITRQDEGTDHMNAWKFMDRLGVALQVQPHAHENFAHGARN